LKKRNKNIIFVTLFIPFMVFLLIPKVQAANLTNTLYSFEEPVPEIDGFFESSIWNTTTMINVTLYDITDQLTTMNISVMSVYNESLGLITFGFIFEDNVPDLDTFGIVFKTNAAYDLYVDNSGWGYGIGHDVKWLDIESDDSYDLVTVDYGFESMSPDSSNGGTGDDVYSRNTHNGLSYNTELKFYLDSGDPGTMDVSLAHNDQIDFTLYYGDFTTSTYYNQLREDDNDFDYCSLVIGEPYTSNPPTSNPPTSSLPVFSKTLLITSFASTMLLLIFVTRKRKK